MRTLLFATLLLAGCPTDKPADTSGEGGTRACGPTLACDAAAVCVTDQLPPACTEHADTGAACPDGTTATYCGGAGMPCCCEPAPEPTYRCVDAGACGAAPACDCLGDVCPDDLACSAVASEDGRAFQCEELPKP